MEEQQRNPNRYLFVPGPHAVEKKYLDILREPVIGHREQVYIDTCKNLINGLHELLELESYHKTFVTTGHATDMFSNVGQLVSKGGSVVAVNSGPFSEKAIKEMRDTGITVHEFKVEYGKRVDNYKLQNKVQEVKPDVVYITGNNTSTGTYQLKPNLRVSIGDDTLLVVDEVSMMAGFHYDRFAVDFGFAGTQKCCMLPPGLVEGYASERALKKAKDAPGPRVHNLFDLVKNSEEGKPMATDNTSLVRALEARVYDMMEAGGADAINERNKELNVIYANFLKQLKGIGVGSFPAREDASPTVGCYQYDPKKTDLKEVKAIMQQDYPLIEGYSGITIDTGYGPINKMLEEKGIATGRVPLFGQEPNLVKRILERQAELMIEHTQ